MIINSSNIFLKHILLWFGIVLIGQSIIMGILLFASMFGVYYSSSNKLLRFLFSLSGVGVGQETWQPILDFLHPFLPQWTNVMNNADLLLPVFVASTSLHIVFMIYLYSYSCFEYGNITGYTWDKFDQKLNIYYCMKASRVIGLYILMFITSKFVGWLVPDGLQTYASRLIFSITLYYIWYRLWFVIPQIFASNNIIPSFTYSWDMTRRLGLNGVLAFMMTVVARYVFLSIPDVMRFYVPLDYGWTYIIELLYDNLVFIFLVLFDFAAWRQIRDQKDMIAIENSVNKRKVFNF